MWAQVVQEWGVNFPVSICKKDETIQGDVDPHQPGTEKTRQSAGFYERKKSLGAFGGGGWGCGGGRGRGNIWIFLF